MRDDARGAALMMAAMAAFTLSDTFVKAVSAELPLAQILVLRGLATTAAMVALALALPGPGLRLPRRDRGRVALRSLSETAAAAFFLTALVNMPIANAVAIMQALPLVVTLAGAAVLGEPLGWRRLAAILVGLAGVLMIVQPGADGFSLFSLSALAAVACVTLRDLVTRGIGSETPSMTVAVLGSAGVTLLGAVLSLGVAWQPVDAAAGAMLAGSSTATVGAYLCSVMTMRQGALAVVAPFRYTSLLWALLAGLVVFGEWPNALTLAGAALVVATGLFAWWREREIARRRAGPAAAHVDRRGDSL
jgi:S-adenosylmethionine uptake transporter